MSVVVAARGYPATPAKGGIIGGLDRAGDGERAIARGAGADSDAQTFETVGLISAISSWIFSRGSYEGSFRGELEKFARIAEQEVTPVVGSAVGGPP